MGNSDGAYGDSPRQAARAARPRGWTAIAAVPLALLVAASAAVAAIRLCAEASGLDRLPPYPPHPGRGHYYSTAGIFAVIALFLASGAVLLMRRKSAGRTMLIVAFVPMACVGLFATLTGIANGTVTVGNVASAAVEVAVLVLLVVPATGRWIGTGRIFDVAVEARPEESAGQPGIAHT
ncbi:hypothetical protein [Nocardia sp. NPDC050710]|uniref:hypothetical protein n=1 Tax=Nocardia sp. NPDC050710 TaxID=3157220 RepID=UPI0033CFD664